MCGQRSLQEQCGQEPLLPPLIMVTRGRQVVDSVYSVLSHTA